MTLDDYKTLMRFHILLCDKDISKYKYASVERNGYMWVYVSPPVFGVHLGDRWSNDTPHFGKHINFIAVLPAPEDPTQTLILI